MQVKEATEDFFAKADEMINKCWSFCNEKKNLKEQPMGVKNINDTLRRLETSLQKSDESTIMISRIQEQIKHLKGQTSKTVKQLWKFLI